MQTIKKSQYRQRIYQMPDGTIQIVFGDQASPLPGDVKLLADHDVEETCTVKDHVPQGG